jgi:hypothetical protein
MRGAGGGVGLGRKGGAVIFAVLKKMRIFAF